ncbi:hypothetical protein M9H77_31390 [Catharanthus roseus]|uniref:Uncharacterized protein n=1 Tax=Catharanthus roseus TaxID=4058 RepID=A0ACC0A469_CATRO|nr:hypothetical protein M9H77_31390 [Catharanthus roseus]
MSLLEIREILATFLASTPLLEQSWKLCILAKTAALQSYVVNQIVLSGIFRHPNDRRSRSEL